MTTLITGAGLVGTAYAREALGRNEKVVFLDPIPREDYLRARLGDADYALILDDVRHMPGLIAAIEEHKPDTVLHTAGLIGRRVEQPLHNGMDLNIRGILSVAEAVRLAGVKRLIHISTFGAYDWRRPADAPITESFPRGTGTPYSNTKAAQELILEAYQRQYGFTAVVLRPANVFGVGHFWGGSGGGRKVQDLVEAGIRGTTARIPEEQTMSFEYLYEKDMGRALDLAATRDLPGYSVFNIGMGEVTSFDRLIGLIKTALPNLKVEIVPGRAPVSREQHMDIGHAAEVLGWTPAYTLEQGFAAYAEELKTYLD